MERTPLPEPSKDETSAAKDWLQHNFPETYRDLDVTLGPEPGVRTFNAFEFSDIPGEPWDPATVQPWAEAAGRAVRIFYRP